MDSVKMYNDKTPRKSFRLRSEVKRKFNYHQNHVLSEKRTLGDPDLVLLAYGSQ